VEGIVLVVVSGADRGRRYEVPVGCYRVVGRADGMQGGTLVVGRADRRRLEREDQLRAVEHLRRRASQASLGALLGARAEVAAFTRLEDIDLTDEAVSQTHVMVFCDEAGASLVDVASTNGTYVNGEKRHESAVVPGDLLRVGETRLDVHGLA
jgi:hypothetical protein